MRSIHLRRKAKQKFLDQNKEDDSPMRYRRLGRPVATETTSFLQAQFQFKGASAFRVWNDAAD